MGGLPKHILLLEDDPLMQRFVVYALEQENLVVTCCDTVASAVAAIQRQSFSWILTDLMLPGESGLSFIEKISHGQIKAGTAQIVALSAGIDLKMKKKLASLGVHRQLLKPVSVLKLQELFRDEQPSSVDNSAAWVSSQAKAIDTFFAGQSELYERFSLQSQRQFLQDAVEGSRLLKNNNYAALRNLAHSLKSVLMLLGEDLSHAHASTLEDLIPVHATDKANSPLPPLLCSQIQTVWRALVMDLNRLAGTERTH